MLLLLSDCADCSLPLVCHMKMFPITHKTVIVLDRCPYFLDSSQQPVEFDMLLKSKVAGVIPLAPISKSLWTCNVEAVLEYIRVVYDLFPSNKLVCSLSR